MQAHLAVETGSYHAMDSTILRADAEGRTHIQSALRGLRQAEGKFEANSGYVRRPCLKWKKEGEREKGKEGGTEGLICVEKSF